MIEPMDAKEEGRSRGPEARERTCVDCAFYEGADSERVWALCKLHLIAVKKNFETCEKFRLKEGS